MIATCYGATPFTTKDIAERTDCCPERASAKLRGVADRLVNAALAHPHVWAASGRPDRVARAVCDFVIAAGPIAKGDPPTFRQWICELLASSEAAAGG